MKTEDEAVDQIWDLMERIGFCMLATRSGEDIRARPMAAHPEPMENAIYFLTDAESTKDDEIARWPNVGLAFADSKGQKYVSVTGTAELSNDRDRIRELWTTPAKAWWNNADDPAIRVLKITPKYAEYWNSPGTMVSYVKMLAAAVTDTRPEMGENAKVRM
jgi:general stress protein 26